MTASCLTTPLLARDREVELLDRVVARAAAGGFTVVAVCGEPGIGKTRILQELGVRATAAGLPVYAGHATEFEQEVPFAMYAEALGVLLDGQGPVRPDDVRIALAALRGHTGGPAPGRGVDRCRTYAGVRRLLAEDGRNGAVLLLDDLHWADHASLELTEYLIRKPPPIPMAVGIALRSARPPARLVDAIARHGPSAVRIDLPRLGHTDLAPLLAGASDRRRRMILRAGLGNPLYVQALSRLPDDALAALLAEHGPDQPWAGDTGHHILAGLASEVLTLGPAAQAVAFALAVIGDQATVDIVAHVARVPRAEVIRAVDQMYGLGHVEVDGVRCRYRHPLMRAAVRALTGPAGQFEAHARAAAYLRERHGPVQVRAYHTEQSARPGDQVAATTLIEAGQAFAYSAPMQAARWLGTALRIMRDTGPLHALRSTAQLWYARALVLGGDLDAARAVLADLRHAEEPVRTEAEALRALAARLRGDIDEAAAILEAQLRRRAPAPAVEGKLHVELAAIGALREDAGAAVSHAERALALLDADRPALGAAAQALRAFGSLYSGEVTAACEHIAAAARMADAASDAVLRPHVELLGPLSWVEIQLGRLPEAGRHLSRAREVAESLGHSSALPYLLVVQSVLHARVGRLTSAVTLAREAAAAAEPVGSAEMRAMADAVCILPLIFSAGPAAAIAVAGPLAEADRPRSAMWRRVGRMNLAVATLAAGDPCGCLDLLSGPTAWPANPSTAVLRQVLHGVALARLGETAAAQAAADRAEILATDCGLGYELGLAGYAQAHVAARARRYDEAASRASGAAVQLVAAG
ncbi:MAG TPA: ATP-binding protein, partial [Rugosimonospora sp.]|nr:ATP-binding protein [Rugosimonospora sp.]